MTKNKLYRCDIDNCNYKSNQKYRVKRHKRNVHNIDIIWHYCDIDNCDHKEKEKTHLKRHKRNIHNIDVVWHNCDIKECNYKTKEKTSLKFHKRNRHNIDVIWYECNLCEMKFKDNGKLKRHLSYQHNINITWYVCDIEKCDSKFKTNEDLKRHKRHKHDIDVIWYDCDIQNCTFKCKSNSELKHHKTYKHKIGVIWRPCTIDNCDYKGKSNVDLKQHLANKHNINVKWYYCNIDECNTQYKSKSNLAQHQEKIHDIGKHKCDICLLNRNSNISFTINNKKQKICRYCFNKLTNKDSKIEKIWSDFVDKHIGKEYLLGSDKSLRNYGGCQLYRPDKLYIGLNIVELDECDENQHKWNNGSYKCEEKRISDIYNEEGIIGKNLIVIRWNPHKYNPPNKEKQKSRNERLELFIQLKKYLRNNPPKEKIHIYYMFYDKDNPHISKNIQHTFIYNSNDIEKISI